jgi:leucyl aminopeptidase (aminopeptidase T)
MNDKEAIEWLKNKDFAKYAESKKDLMIKTLKHCIKPNNEKVLILGDTGFENKRLAAILSYSYYLACKELNLETEIVLQTPKENREFANENFEKKLLELPDNSILLVALSNKLGKMRFEKSYRTYCNKHLHRFLSTPSLGGLPTEKANNLFNAFDINYEELQNKHSKLKKILDNTNELKIITDAGTNLILNIKDIKAISASGVYTTPGTGGNLPGGEVYLHPTKEGANGKVVVDVCLRTKERSMLVETPFTIKVENGKVTSIEGAQEAEDLKYTLDWAKVNAKHPENVSFLCELGIGTNPKAIPSGVTIIDEKLPNTAHIAIGSNYWFGGPIRTIIHLDQVFKKPKIYADNELISF